MICLKCSFKINTEEKEHYGLHEKCFTEWFNAPFGAEFMSLQKRSSTSSSDQQKNPSSQNTSFFHGKFKKYSANLNNEAYILKMRQEDAQELPEVEYLCNQIAKSLNVPVAEFFFINFNGDRTFVTKNFIKPTTPTDLQHIYHFRQDDQHSCEGIIQAIMTTTQKPHDVKTFIKTTLFDALIGNHDRHGRNLAFIRTAKGMSLSPIYDNVSYLTLESGNMLKADFNPTGKISTEETNEPSMCDYVKDLKRLGYQDDVDEFYQSTKLSEITKMINESFCSVLMKDAVIKLVTKRFKELENELSK